MKTALLVMLLGGVLLPQQPATNYDESKVPAYTLPGLLVMNNGDRVRDSADWARRRAEIRSVLESQMFGRAPIRPADISFSLESVDKTALGGTAVRKQGSIAVAGKTLNLLL